MPTTKRERSATDVVRDLYGPMRDQAAHLKSARDGARGGATKKALEAGETAVAALATGVVAGRYGTANIPGTQIPGGLTVGAALMAGSIFGWVPPNYRDHAFRVGLGAFDAWVAMYGLGVGQQMAEKAGAPTGTVGIGGLPGASGVGCGPAVGCPPQGRAALGPVTPFRNRHIRPLTEAEVGGLYARSM